MTKLRCLKKPSLGNSLVRKSAFCRAEVGSHVELSIGHSFKEEVLANVDMFRVGGGGQIFSQVLCPRVILVHRGTSHVTIWEDKTPDVTEEYRFLESLSHCYILRFRGRQCDTSLRPREECHTGTSTHYNTARHRFPACCLTGIVRIYEKL